MCPLFVSRIRCVVIGMDGLNWQSRNNEPEKLRRCINMLSLVFFWFCLPISVGVSLWDWWEGFNSSIQIELNAICIWEMRASFLDGEMFSFNDTQWRWCYFEPWYCRCHVQILLMMPKEKTLLEEDILSVKNRCFVGRDGGGVLYSHLYNSKYEHLREMSSVSKVNCVFFDNFECVWKKNPGKTFISSTKLHSSRLRCIYCINWLLPIKRLRVEAINALFYRNLIVLAIFSSISLLILQPFNI